MLELRAADLHLLHDPGGRRRALPGVRRGQAQARRRPRPVGARATGTAVATTTLVAINVLVFLVEMAQGVAVRGVGGSELVDDGAIYGPAIADGEWWRMVTGGFLHAGLIHLAFNMYLLWMLGGALERYAGACGSWPSTSRPCCGARRGRSCCRPTPARWAPRGRSSA